MASISYVNGIPIYGCWRDSVLQSRLTECCHLLLAVVRTNVWDVLPKNLKGLQALTKEHTRTPSGSPLSSGVAGQSIKLQGSGLLSDERLFPLLDVVL